MEPKDYYKKGYIQGRIPQISFPEGWLVQIIPPFQGAAVRFRVNSREGVGMGVSVYLDVDDSLGCMGKPYWEIYPYPVTYEGEVCEDTFRCYMDEVDLLLDAIQKSLIAYKL